jgi:hypothetical protein
MDCNSTVTASLSAISDPNRYTSCYCEENIYILAKELLRERELAQCKESESSRGKTCPEIGNNADQLFVVFISSVSKATPIWCQRSQRDTPDTPVMWDYHVVLLLKKRSLYHTSTTSTIVSTIYDYDSTLPFPEDAGAYAEAAFRPYMKFLPDYSQ